MSGPVVITGLACHFAPETRNLAQGGTATRYAFGKCLIDFPRPEGGKVYMRRLHGGPSVTADYAPVADLADLAEREQTTDGMKKENNNKRRQAQ